MITKPFSINLSQDEFLAKSIFELERGTSISKHDFHFCTISTCKNNIPDSRTVVLRKCDFKRQTILFHTDIRSEKVSAIKQNPNISLLFYSKSLRLQLRFSAHCHIQHNSPLAEACFDKTNENSRLCYQYKLKPGEILKTSSKEESAQLNDKLFIPNGYENFAVCVCNFTQLDLLFLNHKSHIRINYLWDKHGNISSKYVCA